MSTARLFLLLIGVGFLWYIVRLMLKNWLGGDSREELLASLDREERLIEHEAGDDVPACPLCGGDTRLHSYPHIRVWRCSDYPACRGFVKSKKPSRAKFAADWERRKGQRD